jgi:hypothetical protein
VSIRSWQAQPSQQIELDGKVWPVVSQDDLIKALLDGAILLDRAGGCLTVVLQRKATLMPNEMVTCAAVVQWADRTNAKAQPEAPGLEVVEPMPAQEEPLEVMEPDEADRLAVALAAEAEASDNGAEPELPDVDEADVPEHLRG